MDGSRQDSQRHRELLLSSCCAWAKMAACTKKEQKNRKGPRVPQARVTITTNGEMGRQWGGVSAVRAEGICLRLPGPRAPLVISQSRLQPLVQPTFKLILCLCWSEMLTLPLVPETCPFRPFTCHFTTSKIHHLPKKTPTDEHLQPMSFIKPVDLDSRINLTG